MLEFTGERVVPGVADPNLFNEHKARYRFAARLAQRVGPNATVLDAGCGTGYGTAEFTGVASVTAFDISAEAVRDARDNFGGHGVRMLQAGCESLPFADGSFDLVVAFEVIEHLERWPDMLREARRVLKPSGVLLVSTPNKSAYAESRADAGPNPFHVHEFEYEEFSSALQAVFPHVNLWTQNHAEGIAFLPPFPATGALDAPDGNEPQSAHFYLAACSLSPLAEAEAFAYLPASGNILRERERHIALLRGEVEQKTAWLERLEADQAALHREHEAVLVELGERNGWAEKLNRELAKSGARILELQDELSVVHQQFMEQIAAMETDATRRLEWIRDLESQISGGRNQIERLDAELASRSAAAQDEIDRLNQENTGLRVAFEERTRWGESMAEEAARLDAVLGTVENSWWLRLGRALHLVPDVRGNR